MDSSLRPSDKYWAMNGVYLGATTGYKSPEDMIVPWYAVLTVGPGHRELVRGTWAVKGGSCGPDPLTVGDQFGGAVTDVSAGRVAAAVMVCMLSHPVEGDDYPPVVSVVDMAVHASVFSAEMFDPLPGLQNIRDAVVIAYRRANNLDPAKFVRPEPKSPSEMTTDELNATLSPEAHEAVERAGKE